MKRTIAIGAVVAMAVGLPIVGMVGGTAQAAGNTRLVATTGADTGNCLSAPCATINYAIGQALPADTVSVAAGTYHQQVVINKPVKLVGANATTTIIDGGGLDGDTSPAYGVVYVGTTGGSVTIKQLTITNPFPYAYTGGEPMAVALADTNSNDAVIVTQDVISEGTSDTNAGTDFPIGIDSFQNSAQTVISTNTLSGTFQGALLEDNGPVMVTGNTFKKLISNTDGPTVYPAEGVFFLSDLAGSLTGQSASGNTFKSYSGYGVAWDAGYNNGNCSVTPCDGSISGSVTSNTFALTSGPAATGIYLSSEFTGNDLTATVSDNQGTVTSPSTAIVNSASNGGTLMVTEQNNSLSVAPAPPGPAAATAGTRIGGLRSPTR